MGRSLRSTTTKKNSSSASTSRGGGSKGGRIRNKGDMYGTSKTVTLMDAVDLDDEDEEQMVDTRDMAPASVAASLDTPNNSPAHDGSAPDPSKMGGASPPKLPNINYYGCGPKLSDDSDSEPDDKSKLVLPPTPAVQDPCEDSDDSDEDSIPTTRRGHRERGESETNVEGVRKRRIASSPEPAIQSKRSNNEKSPPRSRPRKRGGRGRSSSASSSASSSSRSSRNSCTSSNVSNVSRIATPTPMLEYDLPPKTPSPYVATERPYSPLPEMLDREVMSPSPFLLPPPTPCVVRVPSPPPPPTPCPRPKRERKSSPQPTTSTKIVKYGQKAIKIIRSQESALAKPDKNFSGYSSEIVPHHERLVLPGTIKSVKMVNIMSHTHFQQEWRTGFNFIIGENGSGKSAILSAIVAGLGGKAYDTGRANSMRGLIRTGQRNARIEVTLNNYYTEKYGEDIKIVRTFSREGSSRYQIRDANNVMRSLTRHELNVVLAKLNIQVDNPLAILHQEIAKSFICNKDPSDMYNFFYRALLLGSCESLLKRAGADLAAAKQCLVAKDNMLSELKNEEMKLKKKVDLIESLRNVKDTLKRLDGEYQWALIKEQEATFNQIKLEFDEARKRLDEGNQEKNNTMERVHEEETNLASSQQMWQTVDEALTNVTNDVNTQLQNKHALKLQLRNATGALSTLKLALTNQHNHLAGIERKVHEHKSSVEDIYERQKREQEQRHEELKGLLAAAHNEDHDLAKRLETKRLDNEVAAKTEAQLDHELRDLKKRLQEKRQEQRECNLVKKTKYDVYGKEMVKLMDRIQNAKFNKPPKGPMGSLITIKEEKWAPLIEYILGGELNAFVVDNNEDKQTLLRFIEEIYPAKGPKRGIRKPNVTMLRYMDRRMDIRKGIARCQHPTVIDQIDTLNDDFVVYNWIIEVAHVEKILLFDNANDGCDMMNNRSIVPKTCIRGYSLDGYLFNPDPNYRCLTQHHYRGNLRFLKVSSQQPESVKEQLQGEINVLELDHQRTQQKISLLKETNKDVKNELAKLNEAIRSCKIRQNQIRAEIDDLNLSVCNAPDINSWMDEIAEIKQSIAVKNQDKARHEQEAAEVQQKIKELTLTENSLNAKVTELQSQQSSLYEQKQRSKQRIDELKRELSKKESLCTNLQRALVELNKKCKDAEKSLKAKRAEVEQKWPARPSKLSGTSHEIQVKREALKSELKKNESNMDNREAIKREYENARETALRVSNDIRDIKLLLGVIMPTIKLNTDHFVEKTKEYGISIRTCFKGLIKSRGYQGDLHISEKDKTLVCYVTMESSASARAQRNIQTKHGQHMVSSKKGIMEFASGMSGGERSFTTICFLVACWQIMDMPFYVLDEFDVFMDHYNRKASQDILLNVTKYKPFSQFFVFSPLEKAMVPPATAFTLKLAKPQRKGDDSAIEDAEQESSQNFERSLAIE